MGGKVRIVQIKLRGIGSLRGGDTVRGVVILENSSKHQVIPCEASVQLIGKAHAEFQKSSTQFIGNNNNSKNNIHEGGPRTATTYHFTGENVIQNTVDHIWDDPPATRTPSETEDSETSKKQQQQSNPAEETTTSERPKQAQHVEIDASQTSEQPVRQRSFLSLVAKSASWRSNQSSQSNSNNTTASQNNPRRRNILLPFLDRRKHNHPEKDKRPKYIHVPSGKTFEVPFAFPLKQNAPGSVHEGYLENGCHLGYSIHATVREVGRRWGRPLRLSHPLTVLPSGPRIKSNVSDLLQPVELSLRNQRLYKHFGRRGSGFLTRSFFSKSLRTGENDDDDAVPGTVSLRLQLDRRAYAPGQHINLMGSFVENDTTEPQWVFMGVRMHLHLHGLGQNGAIGHQRHTKHRDYCFVHEQLEPGMRKELHRYPLPISMLPSFDGSGLSPNNQHPSMKWSYELFLWTGDPSKAGVDTASPDVLNDGTQINVGTPVTTSHRGTTGTSSASGSGFHGGCESTMSIQGGLSTTTAFFGHDGGTMNHRSPMAEVKVPVLICSEPPPVYLPSWAKNKEAYIRPLDPLEQHSQNSLWDIFEIAQEEDSDAASAEAPALLQHLYDPAPKRQRRFNGMSRSNSVKNPFRFSMNKNGRHQSSRKILIRMGGNHGD